MSNWRDSILKEFPQELCRLTIVSDPDDLLTEELLNIELQSRGYDIIDYVNSIEFRYAFESKYRQTWDQGSSKNSSVVVRLQSSEIEKLPFDLLQAGRKLSFSLGDLFQDLSYPVIESLGQSHLDALMKAQEEFLPGRLGDNATKDFVLRHIFGIASELVVNEKDLLRLLLRTHYGDLQLPHVLTDHLLHLLVNSDQFSSWPLDKIIQDKNYFFSFLQERWPFYLIKRKIADDVREVPPEYGFEFDGPADLPFEHQDIRIYINNLFVEKKLKPISVQVSDAGSKIIKNEGWISSGIVESDPNKNESQQIKLFELIENEKPSVDNRFTDWISFSLKWAELSASVHNESNPDLKDRFILLDNEINDIFAEWLELRYASLITLPPTTPAMLHHVPRRLARELEMSVDCKIALVVMDGLSMSQWIIIRNILDVQLEGVVMKESATFAWIPTLTSVSRQAIFSGMEPFYFPNSIDNTNNESKLWNSFWEKHHVSKSEIAYCRGLGDGNPVKILEDVFNLGSMKVIGLVVDKVDKIMHGMQLGSAGMHNQIKQWCEQEYLKNLLEYLLENDFQVWITADHGNVECIGTGNPAEGSIAKSRGERARVYPTPELRLKMKNKIKNTIEWQSKGLPSNYYPLLAGKKTAFVKKGVCQVGHGGASIEEVIVPLIKIERRN